MDNPAIITLIGTLAGTLIGGLITWFSLNYQFRIKKAELQSQSALRARELLFESYQKKLEQINGRSHSAGETIGKFIAQIMTATNEDEKEEILEGFLVIVRALEIDLTDSIDELEKELREAGLFEKRRKEISFLREHIAIDLSNLSGKEMEALQFKIVQALGIETKLLQELVNKKCEDLFSDYLPRSGTLTNI
jgi:hypothetical protein